MPSQPLTSAPVTPAFASGAMRPVATASPSPNHATAIQAGSLWEFIFRHGPTPCVVSDEQSGEILQANDEFARFFHLNSEALQGTTSLDLNIWPSKQERDALIYRLRQCGKLRNVEVRHFVNGQERTVLLSIDRFVLEGRHCILSSYIDITERKELENAFRQTITVFEQAGEAIVIMDDHYRVMNVNPAFTRLTGFDAEDAAFQRLDTLLHEPTGRYPAGLLEHLTDQMHDAHHWEGELWATRKDGSLFSQRINLTAVINENQQLENYVALFSDHTQQREQTEALHHMAHHDPLTGLPNRHYLAQHLSTLARQPTGHGQPVALLFCDLDNFKQVNDLHGHDIGDQLLQAVALRLQQGLRATDTIARVGGDEFVVILEGVRSPDCVEIVARQIMQQLATPIAIGSHSFSVGASVGAAIWPMHGDTAELLLRHADQALYRAKAGGRGTYVLWQEHA